MRIKLLEEDGDLGKMTTERLDSETF